MYFKNGLAWCICRMKYLANTFPPAWNSFLGIRFENQTVLHSSFSAPHYAPALFPKVGNSWSQQTWDVNHFVRKDFMASLSPLDSPWVELWGLYVYCKGVWCLQLSAGRPHSSSKFQRYWLSSIWLHRRGIARWQSSSSIYLTRWSSLRSFICNCSSQLSLVRHWPPMLDAGSND